MKRSNLLILFGLVSSLALAGSSLAAADPDLIVLDSKVRVEGTQLGIISSQLDFHITQHFISEPQVVANFQNLSLTRQREVERVLLECAQKGPSCLPPAYTVSALDPDCTDFAPPGSSGHHHDVGFTCPLREVIMTLLSDLAAVKAQGLARDVAAAQAHLDAAIAAALAKDSFTAFAEACAGFKLLSCP